MNAYGPTITDALGNVQGAHERSRFRARAVDFVLPIALGVGIAMLADRYLDWPKRDAITAGFLGAVLQGIIVEAVKRSVTPAPPGAGYVG